MDGNMDGPMVAVNINVGMALMGMYLQYYQYSTYLIPGAVCKRTDRCDIFFSWSFRSLLLLLL